MVDNQSMELMHELLKKMNTNLSDIKQGQVLTNERLSSIEHHMEGFYKTSNIHCDELALLKDRIEHIEKKLGLIDGDVF